MTNASIKNAFERFWQHVVAKIGDTEASLDAIIDIQEKLIAGPIEPIEPKEITFYIDDIAYNALEGMTWSEWIESEYNTHGAVFIDSNNEVCTDLGDDTILALDLILDNDYIRAYASDELVDQGIYIGA